MIIVPRAKSVEDQTLAKLLLAAHERGTPLVLLHDQSKRNSCIASHRLAAYAADRLASVAAVDDESYADAVERYLRAGLVGPAVQLIAQHFQEFGFKAVAPLSDEDAGFDFIVCNNPRRVEGLNEGIRVLPLAARQAPGSNSIRSSSQACLAGARREDRVHARRLFSAAARFDRGGCRNPRSR